MPSRSAGGETHVEAHRGAQTLEPIEPGTGPALRRGPWGSAHPLLLSNAAPNGAWVSVCQARQDTNGDGVISVSVGPSGELGGDRLSSFFLQGSGEGEPIEAWAGSDPSGRYVVLQIAGSLILRDTVLATNLDLSALGADPRDDQSSFRQHRSIAFSPDGTRMLYLQRPAAGGSVMVRELSTGNEVTIDPGPGLLWRAGFDRTSRYVQLEVVTEDTNQNRRLDWTVPAAERPQARCVPPLARFNVWQYPGDRAIRRLARTQGGTAVDAERLVVTLGNGWLERYEDGSLVAHATTGANQLVAPKACESRVLHADAARNQLLVTCRRKNGRAGVRLISAGGSSDLPYELGLYGGDHWFEPDAQLVPIYAGRDAILFDLEARRAHPLKYDDRIVGVHGARALVLRDNQLLFVVPGEPERAIDGTIHAFARVHRARSTYALFPVVVDLMTGKALGRHARPALAVSQDGRALVAVGKPPDATGVAVGPLEWEEPTP